MRQLLLDFTQAPAPTFVNFVPGRNVEPLAAVRAAVSGIPERVLYLWGGTGAGKTHLLRAFAASRGRACFVRGEDYAGTESGGTLVLDEVERLGEVRQVALFNAFNDRAFELIVVSAHAAPRDVALRRDLATRLATGLTYRLLPLTDGEKREALAAHARARGFPLPDEVAAYLLTHARHIQNHLTRAVNQGQIETWFQPIVDARTGQCHSVEVLARWLDGEYGWISPTTFIPMAESLRLIGELGLHIVKSSLDAAQEWQRRESTWRSRSIYPSASCSSPRLPRP